MRESILTTYKQLLLTKQSFDMAKKKTHGGKRKGSGRPKGETTKTMRVPVSKVEEVNLILSRRSPDKSVGQD